LFNTNEENRPLIRTTSSSKICFVMRGAKPHHGPPSPNLCRKNDVAFFHCMSEFLARAPGRQTTREHATSQPDQEGARPLVSTQSDPAEGLLCLKQAKRRATGNTAGATRKPALPKCRPRPLCLSLRDLFRHNGLSFSVNGQPLASSPVIGTARIKQVHSRPKPGHPAYFHTTRSC